jgi:hypothetical protein
MDGAGSEGDDLTRPMIRYNAGSRVEEMFRLKKDR